MAIAKLFKWNALVLISFFLIACSDSGGGAGTPRGLETPIGHSIIEGNEGTSVLTLYFISPVDGPLTYSTFNITAAEKSDYELLADTFQAEKDKEYAFDVIVYGDTQIEGDESLGINFKNAQGESVGTIIGSIINDDYPSVSVTSPQVIEGDTGTPKLVFTFSLSAAVVDDYSITVSSIGESASLQSTFANLATPEIDFLPVNQELVFKSGELEKQLEVSVYADNLIENDETVVLSVLREGQPILAEVYASGIIRTDETPDINGFQLSVKDGELQTDITEGSSINPFELTWKKIDYEITVSKPQNILQEQNLIFTLLPYTEAKAQYGVTYGEANYVNLTDSHDLCFNDLSLDNALECQTSLNYILKQDDASFVISIYVKEDITRELSEIFIMNIGNDQNVLFSNYQAKIINDDSENLQIKIGDEFVDLKTFTSNQSVYELTEPRAATQGTAKVIEENTLTFRINSPLDIEYSPEYELNKYFKERPADNGEYSYADDNKTLIFSKDSEAPQDVTLGINLESDGTYDGDKYITLTFKETDISPLIIKIIDSDYPKLEATTKQAGVNQDSIVDNGFSYIELLEQPSAESKANEDGYMEYQYTLSQGVAAEPLLSDIRYKVTLQNAGIGKGESLSELTCLSPGHTQEYNLATLTGDDSDVSIFDNKGAQVLPGGEILLEEGATSYDLTIRVKNDAAIECQEVFQLTVVPALAPEDIQAEVALSQNFIIKDTDKALVTVQSWQTAETDAATKTQNFQFNANKKVNAILTPILMGQGLNCNADDLNPPTGAATAVSLTPDSLEPTFPIYIKGDTTVEPNEACELKIGTLSADLETLIEVQYLDSTGVVIENGEYATGFIENDDKLNIGIVTTDVTEPAKGASNISVGTYSWDKKIAPNVGKIAIKATPTACTGLQNCVEDSDTTLGLHDANPVEAKEIVIHKGDETAILLPSPSTDLPISIIGDDIVEEIETLNFSVTQSAGGEYIREISDTDVSINITSEDRLELQLTGSNTLGEPSSDSTPYTLSWNKQLELPAGSLPEIRISLSDTKICGGGETLECMSENLDYNLDSAPLSLNNGSRTNLALTNFTLKPDILVELPEALNLTLFSSSPYIESITHITSATGFVTSTSELNSVVTHALDWELQVTSDDKITIRRQSELDTIAESCTAEDSCATVASLIFTGEIPKNGPTITLSVNNNCAMPNPVDGTNPNQCASEVLPSTDLTSVIDSSESDFKFNENYQSINIHTYDEKTTLDEIDIKLTVNNDSWVEVTEKINLNYEASMGEGYIEALPSVQVVSLTSDDTTEISISRNAATSSCQFIAGTTTFNEFDCNDKSSQYDLAITNSIAKEVETIEVALDLSTSSNTLIFKKSDAETARFDVAANIKTEFVVPDGNKKLYLPVHTKNSATEKNTQLKTDNFTSNVTFKYLDDSDAEPRETLDFKLEPNPGSLYTIAAGHDGTASETIIDDDSVKFWLTAATNQQVTEKDTNNSNNTKLSYTLNWGDTILADVEKLTFDFVPVTNKQTTATWNVDYKISESSNLIAIKNNGTTIEFDNSNADVAAGSIDLIVEIIGDKLVEIDETISATLSISDTYTSQLAAVGNDNVAVDVTIPNDDSVTVTLYGINESDEGDDSVTDLVMPFSYSIDKSIAANVPTIEVYMDASTCVSGTTINCAESNDYSFGGVAATQMITVHQGPVMDAQGELGSAGIYTEKSAVDANTGETIKTEVPLNFVTDNRVEAHETLIIKFSKVGGALKTNLQGRSFIQGLKNGDDQSDICTDDSGEQVACEELDKSVVILNDDKLRLILEGKLLNSDLYCEFSRESNANDKCQLRLVWADSINNVLTDETKFPIIDDDTGEISLPFVQSNAATASNKNQYENDNADPLVVIDPQDYQVVFADETNVQHIDRLVIKKAGNAMVELPRIIEIKPIDDTFVEKTEKIEFNIIRTSGHEYIENLHDHINSKHNHGNNDIKINFTSLESDDELIVEIFNDSILNSAGTEIVNPNFTEGKENTQKTLQYTAKLSHPVAKGYPSISLDINKHDDQTAILNTDFTLSTQSLQIHDDQSPTYNLLKPIVITVTPEEILERDESIKQTLELDKKSGASATLAGLPSLDYTIKNDDILTVTFTENTEQTITEGTGAANRATFTYSTDRKIAKDYPKLEMKLRRNNSSTASDSDLEALSDITLHAQNASSDTEIQSNQTIALTSVTDRIIEKPEEYIVDLITETTDLVIRKETETDPVDLSQLKLTLTNDDFISIDYRCNNVQCNDGKLTEAATANALKVFINDDYTTEGFKEGDNELSIAFTAAINQPLSKAASSNDYSLPPVSLPLQGTTVEVTRFNNGEQNKVITITPDDAIELEESFNIEVPVKSYITPENTKTAFTITNDDFLTVNLETTEPTTDTVNYNLNACRPDGKTLEGGSITLTTTLSKVQDDSVVINDVTHLSCADIGLESNSGGECDDDRKPLVAFEDTIVASDVPECDTATDTMLFAFTAHNSIQPNKWFNIEITTDERCDTDVASGNCIDPTDVIVQNNQLTNVLDTGAMKCLQGRDKRWAGECDDVDDKTIFNIIDYRKQDAAQTTGENNVYPDLAYTFVNGTGQPVPKKPTTGEVCVQDNNTGFIWSATVRDSSNSNKNIRAYTEVASLSEYQDYDCGMADDAGKSWQLPSVQELMTILDVEKLKTARELGIKFTNEGGGDVSGVPQFYFDEFLSDSANYWTSTNCDSGNGYFVLSFLNGELTCAANTQEHSIMMLYKQN